LSAIALATAEAPAKAEGKAGMKTGPFPWLLEFEL